jgi:hypothetical protein
MRLPREGIMMTTIRNFPTHLEANVAKLALDAAGVPSVVVGPGIGMQAGIAGVQLMVPEEHAERAAAILRDS